MTIEAKTIMLKGCNGPRDEAIANTSGVLPGHLLYVMTTGKVAVHAVAGGNCEKLIAIEDELQGRGIDTAYASGSRVTYIVAQRGDWVNALLADGQNVAVGAPLMSNGAGRLTALVNQVITDTIDGAGDSSGDSGGTVSTTTVYTDRIVGYAMAAVDMSGSAGADPSGRIPVRIA